MYRKIVLRTVSMMIMICLLLSLTILTSSANTGFLNSSNYVNVRSHGAKGDGLNDDTAAIRAAIKAAQSRGKTVFFPAGLYLVSQSVTVPAGVNLEGITSACNGPWQNLYDGESKGYKYNGKGSNNFYDADMNPGSWIMATNGQNNVDSGATFQLSGDNSVRKLGFVNLFCPPLYSLDIPPTPPVIGADVNKMTSTKGIFIEDISLSNPYYGIAIYQGSLKNYNTSAKLSGKGSGPVTISNIMGAAMYRGISIIGVKDKVSIDNVQFNYANYGSPYVKQHWNYCVDIDIAASANVILTNFLSFGAYTGLQTSSAFSGSPVNITASNLNLEGEKPLVLNSSGTQTISNSYFLLCHFADASIKKNWAAVTINQDSKSSVNPKYTLNNIVFQDGIGNYTDPHLYIDAMVRGGANIQLTNATMWNWDASTSKPMIKYNHASGSSSKFTITNLALCNARTGQLAAVSGSAYKTGELIFVGGHFPAEVLSSVNTGLGAPIKFTNCTKFSDGSNTMFSN